MKKQFSWFEAILVFLIFSAYLYAACSDAFNFPNRWFIRDDAYYYYKIAQNISEGHGSTFDGINATNGYHPLWMLICTPIFALARFDLILPLRVLVIVTGIIQAATTILLYRLISQAISPPAGILAALYWATDSYILVFLYKTGVESSIGIFFIVLLLYLAYKFEKSWRTTGTNIRQIIFLGIVSTLVAFSRLDLAFFALLIGISIVFRGSSLRYLLPLDVLALIVSTIVAFITRLGIPAYYDSSTSAEIMLFAVLIIQIPILFFFGLYDYPSNWIPLQIALKLFLSVAVGSIVSSVLLIIGGGIHLIPNVSKVILFREAAINLGLLLMIRLVAYGFRLKKEPSGSSSPVNFLKAHWKDWARDASIFYGIVGVSLSIYMICNKLIFGTFSPISGQVKRWWGTFAVNVYGGSAKSMLSFFALDPYSDFDAWQPYTTILRNWTNGILYKESTKIGNPSWQQNFLIILAIAFLAICLILLINRVRTVHGIIQMGIIPLFVGSWIQILSYNITGYAAPKEWYWLTEPIVMTIISVLVINAIYDLFMKRWKFTRIFMWLLVAIFGLINISSYLHDFYFLNPYGQTPVNAPYMDLLPFLEARTKPGDLIGMTGGGNVGYLIHDRTIVNMDGLVNSFGYFQTLKNGTAADYLYNSGVRYIFANPDLLNSLPYRGEYTNRLEPLVSWGGKDLMRLLP